MLVRLRDRYLDLFQHAIPSIIAIFISGVIDVQMVINHPLGNFLENYFKNPHLFSSFPLVRFLENSFQDPNFIEVFKRISWNFIQLIPAFFFGSISDKSFRKAYLIFVQVLGALLGLIFLVTHLEKWIIVLALGLAFNPLSIARASILDNYSRVSAVRIIAWTYFFKNLPWIFPNAISHLSIVELFHWIIPILIGNAILTWWLFKDRFDSKQKMEQFEHKHETHEQNFLRKNRTAIFCSIGALAFAETTFYLFGIYLSDHAGLVEILRWSTLITFGGLALAALVSRIPHLSWITKIYAVLIVTPLALLIIFSISNWPMKNALISSMLFNCIGGGIYLPFVADALIELSGARRRATGSAFAETSDAIALCLAAIVSIPEWHSVKLMMYTIIGTYTIAVFLQKLSEKTVKLKALR